MNSAIMSIVAICTTAYAGTAVAQSNLNLQVDRTPKSDFERSLSNPPARPVERNIPTEYNRGNYNAGTGSGSNLKDNHGNNEGFGAHIKRRY